MRFPKRNSQKRRSSSRSPTNITRADSTDSPPPTPTKPMPSVPVFTRFSRRPRNPQTHSVSDRPAPQPVVAQHILPPSSHSMAPLRMDVADALAVPAICRQRCHSALTAVTPKSGEEEMLRDEVVELAREGRKLREQVEQIRKERDDYREEADKLKMERDEATGRLKEVGDDAPGSAVNAAKRETERVRYAAAWLKLRVTQLERGCDACKDKEETPEQVEEEVRDDIMEAVIDGETDPEDAEDDDIDWKDKEIARLEQLLTDEHDMRLQLEQAVEGLAETLDRRDEEEKRASEHLEERRQQAEDELRVVTAMLAEERAKNAIVKTDQWHEMSVSPHSVMHMAEHDALMAAAPRI